MSKVWLVTGSASGLGRHIAEAVLKSGDRLMAGDNKPTRSPHRQHVEASRKVTAVNPRVGIRFPWNPRISLSLANAHLFHSAIDFVPVHVLYKSVDVFRCRRTVVHVIGMLVHIEDQKRIAQRRIMHMIPGPIVVSWLSTRHYIDSMSLPRAATSQFLMKRIVVYKTSTLVSSPPTLTPSQSIRALTESIGPYKMSAASPY